LKARCASRPGWTDSTNQDCAARLAARAPGFGRGAISPRRVQYFSARLSAIAPIPSYGTTSETCSQAGGPFTRSTGSVAVRRRPAPRHLVGAPRGGGTGIDTRSGGYL